MSSWPKRQPAGDVLFAKGEGFLCEQDEWIKDRTPRDLAVVERVVKMPCADGIFSQDQAAPTWVPDRQTPVANQPSEAVTSPVFIGRRDDRNVCGADRDSTSQMPDKISAIVQAAIQS